MNVSVQSVVVGGVTALLINFVLGYLSMRNKIGLRTRNIGIILSIIAGFLAGLGWYIRNRDNYSNSPLQTHLNQLVAYDELVLVGRSYDVTYDDDKVSKFMRQITTTKDGRFHKRMYDLLMGRASMLYSRMMVCDKGVALRSCTPEIASAMRQKKIDFGLIAVIDRVPDLFVPENYDQLRSFFIKIGIKPEYIDSV